MTLGAKLAKPAPLSGSFRISACTLKLELPNNKVSPILRLNTSNNAVSTHTLPLSGPALTFSDVI